MAINLVKGQKIDLTKHNSGLSKILVGLGWDAATKKKGGLLSSLFGGGQNQNIDIDASVFMLTDNKLKYKSDLIYFGNLKSKDGGVIHTGDNLTGDGDGDDEQIIVDLSKIPASINKLVFVTNIYDCVKRNQNFGMVKNAFVRVADYNKNENIAIYNLTENYNGYTALIVAEVYRHEGEWKFAAIGEGTNDINLTQMSKRFI